MQLLTWNVYFGGHMFEDRCAGLIRELARRRPDVIALQEVTIEHLAALSDLVGYTLSESVHIASGYGVAILTRVPTTNVRELDLPTEMGRSLLAVELATGVTVATVHLESLDEHERRIEQIELIQHHLANRDRVIWCGDFNLVPESPEQAAIDPTWIDAWASLHDEPGYTVDTDRNTMRFQLKDEPTNKRIDRVLSRGLTASAIELVGAEPIDIDGTFISDHFGLLATF